MLPHGSFLLVFNDKRWVQTCFSCVSLPFLTSAPDFSAHQRGGLWGQREGERIVRIDIMHDHIKLPNAKLSKELVPIWDAVQKKRHSSITPCTVCLPLRLTRTPTTTRNDLTRHWRTVMLGNRKRIRSALIKTGKQNKSLYLQSTKHSRWLVPICSLTYSKHPHLDPPYLFVYYGFRFDSA